MENIGKNANKKEERQLISSGDFFFFLLWTSTTISGFWAKLGCQPTDSCLWLTRGCVWWHTCACVCWHVCVKQRWLCGAASCVISVFFHHTCDSVARDIRVPHCRLQNYWLLSLDAVQPRPERSHHHLLHFRGMTNILQHPSELCQLPFWCHSPLSACLAAMCCGNAGNHFL